MRRTRGDQLLATFKADIEKWKPLLNNDCTRLVQGVVQVFCENIVVGGVYGPGTPVDTGYARSSWWVAVNELTGERTVFTVDKSGQAALAEATVTLIGVQAGDVIYILSNTVYMRRLEYGHSQQAPKGMVRVVLANGQHIVDELASRIRAGSKK